MGIPCIDRLGAQIEKSWRSVDYAPLALPELSERLLGDANLPAQLSPDDLTTWALQTPIFPPQADPSATFGQPPITLFRGARFYIDALFWIDGTTSIHQHRFSGAFQVLAGSSIETRFAFETERTFDGQFVIGTLQVSSSGLLRQGEVRPIWSGPRLIHSIFHLERPSVSIVIRTVADPGVGPQFNYSRAGIGRNPFTIDETNDRKVQLVSMLRTTKHPSLETIVGDLIAEADIHTAYRVVRECAHLGIVDRLIDRVPEKGVAERFRLAVKDHRREVFLIGRRNVVSDSELRFFLGVLLNASRRRDVLAITQGKNPTLGSVRQVVSWIRQLSNVTVKLQAEGVPWQPNLLGLPNFDDEIERALVSVLNGESLGFDDRVAAAIAQLRALPALGCLFND